MNSAQHNLLRRRSRARFATVMLVPVVLLTCGIVSVHHHRTPHADIPHPPAPDRNGYQDFIAAARIAQANDAINPNTVSPGKPNLLNPAQFAAHEKALAPALKLVRTAMAKDCVQAVRDYKQAFDDGLACVDLASSMDAIAAHRAASGNLDSALDVWLDGMDFSARLTRGATASTRFFTELCQSFLRQSMDQFEGHLTRQQLHRAHKRLAEAERMRQSVAETMKWNGWGDTEAALLELRDAPHYTNLAGIKDQIEWSAKYMSAVTGVSAERSQIRYGIQAAGFWMADKQCMIDQNIAYHAAFVREMERSPWVVPQLEPPDNLLVQDQRLVLTAVYLDEALWRIMCTRIAVRLFYAEQGRLPTALNELTPAYLAEQPVDPFAGGKPLTYRLRPKQGGFEVQSVGIAETGALESSPYCQTRGRTN